MLIVNATDNSKVTDVAMRLAMFELSISLHSRSSKLYKVRGQPVVQIHHQNIPANYKRKLEKPHGFCCLIFK